MAWNEHAAGTSSKRYLKTLWDDIIQTHWDYIEADENMEKLLKRQTLEEQMRQLLSNVAHDRKFFVPATQHVLSQTVRTTNDFSACNAMNGFEAVHDYANLLLTKPWRKEFKTIRTYSGYYKQEVERNLVEVECLFEEMGYQKMAQGLLVLSGPLCMDQVANVSRDALLAYVECQIMGDIFAQCVQFSIKWEAIFRIREQRIGDVSSTIAFLIGPQQYPYSDITNNYAHAPTPTCNAYGVPAQISTKSNHHSDYSNYSHYPDENIPEPPPPPARYYHQQQHHYPHSIPHSRSLDQYVDPHQRQPHQQYHQSHQPSAAALHTNGGRQSLSFDHAPLYATHNCDYSPAFNVAGQRYPIPVNESQQFPQQFHPTAAYETARHYNTFPALPTSYQQQQQQSHHIDYFAASPRYEDPPTTYNHHPPQQPSAQTTTYAQTVSRSKAAVTQTPVYGTPPDPFSLHHNDHHDPRLLKTPLKPQRAGGRLHFDYEDTSPTTNGSETSRGLSDFDSFDEATANYTNISRSSSSCNRSSNAAAAAAAPPINDINGNGTHSFRPASMSANAAMAATSGSLREKDGLGSYKKWDEVYQSVNKPAKQQKERELLDDRSMQALDLNHRPDEHGRYQTSDKRMGRAHDKMATLPAVAGAHSSRKSTDSIVERPSKTIDRVRPASSEEPPWESRRKPKNILEALSKLPAAKAEHEQRLRSLSRNNNRKSMSNKELKRSALASNGHHNSGAVSASSPSGEWSCAHCTLLNPMSISVCDACCRSKDYSEILRKPSGTTTCV